MFIFGFSEVPCSDKSMHGEWHWLALWPTTLRRGLVSSGIDTTKSVEPTVVCRHFSLSLELATFTPFHSSFHLFKTGCSKRVYSMHAGLPLTLNYASFVPSNRVRGDQSVGKGGSSEMYAIWKPIFGLLPPVFPFRSRKAKQKPRRTRRF